MNLAQETVAVSVPEREEIDLPALTKRLLTEHNNIAAATTALEALAEEDAALYRQIVNGHFRRFCRNLIMLAARRQREHWDREASKIASAAPAANFVASSAVSSAPMPGRFALTVAAAVSGLMDYPIYGGMRLGDCKKPDLLEKSASYRSQADDLGVKARWLRLIADRMPDAKQTVRQAFKEQTLADLRQQARDAAVAA